MQTPSKPAAEMTAEELVGCRKWQPHMRVCDMREQVAHEQKDRAIREGRRISEAAQMRRIGDRAMTPTERSRRKRQLRAAEREEIAALRAELERLRATVASLCAVLRARCPAGPVLENETPNG